MKRSMAITSLHLDNYEEKYLEVKREVSESIRYICFTTKWKEFLKLGSTYMGKFEAFLLLEQ